MTLLAVNVALSDWRQLVFVIIGSNAEKIARPPHPVFISLKNHKNQRQRSGGGRSLLRTRL
jgi:hypothetical protein